MPAIRKISPRVTDGDDPGLINELKAKARALRYIEPLDDNSWEALKRRLELQKRLKDVERELVDRSPHDPDCLLTTTRIPGVLVNAFWALVKRSDTCWLWLEPSGQWRGRCRLPDATFIDSWTHRAVYLIARGQVPEGKDVRPRAVRQSRSPYTRRPLTYSISPSIRSSASRRPKSSPARTTASARSRLSSAGSGLRVAHAGL